MNIHHRKEDGSQAYSERVEWRDLPTLNPPLQHNDTQFLLMLCDQLSQWVRNFPKCALSYAIYLSIRLPKFPSYSPKDVPNSTSILSHLVCPKFNSHVYKLKRYSKLGHICFYFTPGSRELLLLRSAQCSKTFGREPIKVAPSPKNKIK